MVAAGWLRLAAWLRALADWCDPPVVAEPSPLARHAAMVVAQLDATTNPALVGRHPAAMSRWRFVRAVSLLKRAHPLAARHELHLAIEQAVADLRGAR